MRLLLTSVLLVSLTGCGPLVEGELALGELCRDFDRIDIEAAPISTYAELDHESAWVLPQDIRNELATIDATLRLRSVTLTAEQVSDLSFVEHAAVVATIGSASVPFEHDGPFSETSLTLSPPAPMDVEPIIAGEAIHARMTLAGTVPESAWALRIRACFDASARAEWSPPLSP